MIAQLCSYTIGERIEIRGERSGSFAPSKGLPQEEWYVLCVTFARLMGFGS
jgi:hypothetical protein